MNSSKTFNYSINEGFQYSVIDLKGEKEYFVEGYASTIGEDKSGEVITPDAQRDIFNQIQNENITMDLEHEEWYDDKGNVLPRPKNERIPVAKIIESRLTPKGVYVKAQLNTNLRGFKEVWGSIKDGFLKAFSVAFYPVQKVGSAIKHLQLVNVTLTGSPVNTQATFTASMKSASAWMDSEKAKEVVLMAEDDKKKLTPEEEEEEKKKKKEAEQKAESEDSKEDKKEDEDEEKKKKAETKAEPKPDVEKIVADMKAEHAAALKSLNDKLELATKEHSAEVAKLKAELEKPVLKAKVEQKMPDENAMPGMKVTPLGLIR